MIRGTRSASSSSAPPTSGPAAATSRPPHIRAERACQAGFWGYMGEVLGATEDVRACGAEGYTIEDPKDCGAVLDQALAEPGPVVVEAVVDPHEPPMPPKVSLEQSRKFAESLLRGTPNRDKIALTVLSSLLSQGLDGAPAVVLLAPVPVLLVMLFPWVDSQTIMYKQP